jgi:hypothetical protein
MDELSQGDENRGGFTMFIGEMATIVKHTLPVKVIIFKNNARAARAASAVWPSIEGLMRST